MRIFITAVTGYLGSKLAAHFMHRGHKVSGSSRHPETAAHDIQVVRFNLGGACESGWFDSVDLVIHAAHDFTQGALERNVRGTMACFEAARARGVMRQVFLSSCSARQDSVSEYGQTKYVLERIFLERSEFVLRPGLVIGNGGLFQRQKNVLLRAPYVPLIDGGRQSTAIIALSHFVDATSAVIERGKAGEYALFYDARPTMREFVTAVKAQAGQRARILPISAGLAMILAGTARAIGLSLPVDQDQIRSVSIGHEPAKSDLSALLPGREAEFHLGYALQEVAFDL